MLREIQGEHCDSCLHFQPLAGWVRRITTSLKQACATELDPVSITMCVGKGNVWMRSHRMVVKERLAAMLAVYVQDPDSGCHACVAGITDATISIAQK